MAYYCDSFTEYKRLPTREVKVGDLLIGNNHPIRIQTMTTTDTMDTEATVAQSIRCIEAGAELVRITAPSKRDAENLLPIKNEIRRRGYSTPLVADIHFTPNAAEIAARIVEKVRVNPGNYADKKKFEVKEYTDSAYHSEIDRIRDKFLPLIRICKEYGTAMRIGTNHGSLSDRIMSRFGDTPMGMVESAMEFLRIARDENYHQIVLSMKASNPLVMVHAYRLLVQTMKEEFGESYPLHLGVTEAGDGEDGRIKSAMGMGTLLEDGLGDTVRVSLTEEPEFELPVCRDLVKRFEKYQSTKDPQSEETARAYDPLTYKRRPTREIGNTGLKNPPVVIADFSESVLSKKNLQAVGYRYDQTSNKWNLSDSPADYVYTSGKYLPFDLPPNLQVICDAQVYEHAPDKSRYFPLFTAQTWLQKLDPVSPKMNFISIDCKQISEEDWEELLQQADPTVIFCLHASGALAMHAVREKINELWLKNVKIPVILCIESLDATINETLIHFSSEAGALLLEGMGDGIWLKNHPDLLQNLKIPGHGFEIEDNNLFLNNTAFSILQASRTRISKTEYISCPSCGRTLFDLQEVTGKIRSRTHHLKGVKIAVMGCIVNGPGEMADADFGYVGSGPGKITLYRGKEVIKRNVPEQTAVDELIDLLKENNAWVDPA